MKRVILVLCIGFGLFQRSLNAPAVNSAIVHGGDAHFDAGERWSNDSNKKGTCLFQTAAHEIGHSLGLEHTTVKTTLMYAFKIRNDPSFKLHKDDILGIQALYGKKTKKNGSVPSGKCCL